ncbi:hypothetical protein P3X46_025579 [Hevea brasiliensis]|uniref:DUF659 domain-containing protein n=1 Tax=Hevea brasiliensis TaxID=3981 RepID=A0ABQ9L729_HEVBR|nr:hypothetical protein P3X46_025579 [Hevea brasiliensis]
MDSNLEPIPITSQKHDPAWKHCQMFKNGESSSSVCTVAKFLRRTLRVKRVMRLFVYEFLLMLGLDATKFEWSCIYFQPMVDAITLGELEVGVPLYHDIGGSILKNSVEEVKTDFDKQRAMAQEVGSTHILQVRTRTQEQFIVVGRRLSDIFPTLYWAPCAAHLIEQAKSITRFVYNDNVALNMVERYTFGNDIHPLQAMATSQEWIDSPYAKEPGGLEMLDLLSNRSFWSSCILIAHLTNPLLRLLRIVSGNKRLAMGDVNSAYGGSCPNLVRLAISILSQTCILIGRKQNQFPVEQIHDIKNCVERQCFGGLDQEKDLISEDYANSDWMALDPPCANTRLLGPSHDEVEELGAGFDDYEILNRVKDTVENNVEDN